MQRKCFLSPQEIAHYITSLGEHPRKMCFKYTRSQPQSLVFIIRCMLTLSWPWIIRKGVLSLQDKAFVQFVHLIFMRHAEVLCFRRGWIDISLSFSVIFLSHLHTNNSGKIRSTFRQITCCPLFLHFWRAKIMISDLVCILPSLSRCLHSWKETRGFEAY